MSKGNLVRRQVTDRNGVTTTRWVKPEEAASTPRDGFSSVSDFLPVPVLTVKKAVSQDADVLKEQITEALRKSRGSDRGLTGILDDDGVAKAYREDNVPLLEAMLACAAHPTPTMSNVLTAQRVLKRHGVPDPERFLTADSVNLSHRVMIAVLGIQAERGGASAPEGSDIRCLALTADPADYQLIEQIVVERKIISTDEVESLLAEMKSDGITLSDGKL